MRLIARRIKIYMTLDQLYRLGLIPSQLGFYKNYSDMLFQVDISIDDHCITIKISTSAGLIYFGFLSSVAEVGF